MCRHLVVTILLYYMEKFIEYEVWSTLKCQVLLKYRGFFFAWYFHLYYLHPFDVLLLCNHCRESSSIQLICITNFCKLLLLLNTYLTSITVMTLIILFLVVYQSSLITEMITETTDKSTAIWLLTMIHKGLLQ